MGLIYELRGCTVAVVPGHAGKPSAPDPGAVDGMDGQDRLATYEVEHTVRLVEGILVELRALGASAYAVTGGVASTVEELNGDPDLDVALSVHLNAAATPSAAGFELWHQEEEGSANLADAIREELMRAPLAWVLSGRTYRDRGLKPAAAGTRARSFLQPLQVRGVLLEGGFLTNPEEEQLIYTASFARHLAASVGRGLVTWWPHYLAGRG